MRRFFVANETNAKDPRDRVYGLLGLATDGLKITVDYADGKVPEILASTAKAMIEKTGLEVLSYSQFPKEFDSLPSWAPD
jgi:hypothetical protein